MATITYTRNLKLKVSSDLTADAKYNLEKIDTLASVYQTDTNQVARVRSQTDIQFTTQDPNIGGSGSGGSVSFGTPDQPIQDVNIHAASITTSASWNIGDSITLTSGSYLLKLQAPVLTSNLTFILPALYGLSGQVLTTDGSGTLSWATSSGGSGGGGQELVATWTSGTSKTITHNFGTRNIMVTILDASSAYEQVMVDSITRPTDNTIVLVSNRAPVNFTILLKEIL